jgi:outer membrane receptor protein involved in Fe transport
MNYAKHIRFITLLMLCLTLPFTALAQSSNGSISGIVTDDTGAAIPGVTVTATNVATGTARTTISNATGNYNLPNLIPGTYRVGSELSGFQPVKYDKVVVNVGTDTTLNMKLKAGVSETMTVTAAAPVVETTRTEVSSVVNEKAIQNLPVNGRNFIDFVLTTPGVVRDVRGGDISFAGQRGTLNSMVVDGANNDNTFFGQTIGRTGSGRAPYQFSQDAVKEFQVQTNAYSAEYGRAGGAVINVVTKSGTNDFHGSVFDYYRDKQLNANDYINRINNRVKSPYHYDQYGASAGGPIVRDKHFFFANWDVQRNSIPNLVVLGGGRINAFPTDAATTAGLATLTGLADEYSRQQNQDVYLLKTDHEFFANQHLSLRYNKQNFHGINYENGGITNASQHSGNSNVFTDSLSSVYDQTLSSSLFNEARLQYLKDSEPGEANSSAPEAQILQGGVAVLTIGRNSFSPRETTIKRWQLADTATYLLGNHTFKGGFDYSKDKILNYFPGNFFGVYRFNSVADFANGKPAQFTQAFPGDGTTGPTTHPDIKELGLFAQDEWHLNPNVMLSLGIRYDKQSIAQPSVLNPDAQLLAAGYHTDTIPVDKNNIAPRLGIAWTPRSDGRTVVRAGYGIFYGRTPSILIGTAHSNNGINVQTITFTGNLIPTYPNIYSALPTGVTLPKPTIFVFDPNFENPKVQQSSLGVEQQVGSDYSVGVTYQFVKGSDLPRSRDVNVSTPSTVTTATCTATTAAACLANPALINGSVSYNRYTGRPFTNFARVIAFESSARSKYNGLTLDLQKRLSNNWQARVAWTHSTVKDDKPDATAVVPFSSGDDSKYASDPLNLNADYTYGDNDVRDRVVLSGVWQLDSYASHISNGFLHALASGWTISGILSYQSGQPFTPIVGTDLNNDGNPSNDIAPGFTRNSLRYPSQVSLDPRITRDIGMIGGLRLQLIAEAFNLLNRSNVSGENRTYYGFGTDTAGKQYLLSPSAPFEFPTLSTGPRIVQLAARVTF